MRTFVWDVINDGWDMIKSFFNANNGDDLVTRFKDGYETYANERIYVVTDSDCLPLGMFGFSINTFGNITGCWILLDRYSRSSGIGKQIKKFQDTYANAINAKRIYSVVNKTNIPCLKMLKHCGYFVYREGRDCYFLCKSFDPQGEPTTCEVEL